MIEIYVRHFNDAEGKLFNSVDSIEEVEQTIKFFKNNDIGNYEGTTYEYDSHRIIEGYYSVYVEILLETM